MSHKAAAMAARSVSDTTTRSAPRRKWLRVSCVLAFIGCTLATLGAVYGVLLVGVPYQDPTPEMAHRETFHLAVSSGMFITGGGLFLCAALGVACTLLARVVRHLRAK